MTNEAAEKNLTQEAGYMVSWALERPLSGARAWELFGLNELDRAAAFLAFTAMQWAGDLLWIKLEWLDKREIDDETDAG